MSNWTPADWSMFFVALGTLVTAVLSATAAFLANLAKMRGEDNAKSIADNTKLTKVGTENAANNARVAANAASEAAQKTEAIADQLNGKMEKKITDIVRAHTEPILAAMEDIRRSLVQLPERNSGK